MPRSTIFSARLPYYLGACIFLVFPITALCRSDVDDPEILRQLQQAKLSWIQAGRPGKGETADQFFAAAVKADEPEMAEQVLTEGLIKKRMISIPKGGKKVTLHPIKVFHEFSAALNEETYSCMMRQGGWLSRRITQNAIEIWTSKHGWLFDGSGKLLNEAQPPRHSGWGREWYGAFLPDGQWITTDIDEWDDTLSFFSASGTLLKTMLSSQLAPEPLQNGILIFRYYEPSGLIGWARSDKAGDGWIVNVGSELGYATVRIGPDGPARLLHGVERWQSCYLRTLGPRGSPWWVNVPNDSGDRVISRNEAGHGSWVGFPTYAVGTVEKNWNPYGDTPNHEVDWGKDIPSGEYNFGFWPGKKSVFICSETYCDGTMESAHTRVADYVERTTDQGAKWEKSNPIVDKTWFFSETGKLQGWLRGWRIGDAADGQSMLFRLSADSRVVTLQPDMTTAKIRRLAWPDGAIADAVILWDDLKLGLFVRNHHLILARWNH